MEHFANLSSLPPGLEFPPDLQSRIHYDQARKRLVYQGQMWKTTFDRLNALHNNLEYQRAVEHLFRVSTEPVTRPRQWLAPVCAMICVVAVMLLVGAWWYFSNGSTSSPATVPSPSDTSTASN